MVSTSLLQQVLWGLALYGRHRMYGDLPETKCRTAFAALLLTAFPLSATAASVTVRSGETLSDVADRRRECRHPHADEWDPQL